MQSLISSLYFHYFLTSYHRMTCLCSKCNLSTSNQSVIHAICSTEIISVYLYNWEASSHQPIQVFADPEYAEMAEGSTPETCMKADRWLRSVRGTPNISFR